MPKVKLKSFLPHKTLSSKFWNKDETIKEDMRTALLEIADEFLTYLKVIVDVSDITFTGSYANYNYTPYSDVDLHIVIEFADVANNEELVKGFMAAKKEYWNNKYDITLKNVDVELYPQDQQEPHYSSGVFSLQNNAWINKPQKFLKNPDITAVRKKVNMLKKEIDDVIDSENIDDVRRVIEKIKKMRKAGLEKSGEMSSENITFKALRSDGSIQKLYDNKFKLFSDSLSIK